MASMESDTIGACLILLNSCSGGGLSRTSDVGKLIQPYCKTLAKKEQTNSYLTLVQQQAANIFPCAALLK